jgi:hypothetical protein
MIKVLKYCRLITKLVQHSLGREAAVVAARAGGTGMGCCRIWLEEMGLVRAYTIPGVAGLVKFF